MKIKDDMIPLDFSGKSLGSTPSEPGEPGWPGGFLLVDLHYATQAVWLMVVVENLGKDEKDDKPTQVYWKAMN